MKKRYFIVIATVVTLAVPCITHAANNLLHFNFNVPSLTTKKYEVTTSSTYQKYVVKFSTVSSGQTSGYYLESTTGKKGLLGTTYKHTVDIYDAKVGSSATVNLGSRPAGTYEYKLYSNNATHVGQIDVYDTTTNQG